MNDHAYIFGKKKDGAKENVMSKEQLEAITKKICKDYNITYDENAPGKFIIGEDMFKKE